MEMLDKYKLLIKKSIREIQLGLKHNISEDNVAEIEKERNIWFLSLLIPSLMLIFMVFPISFIISQYYGYTWLDIILFVNLPKDQLMEHAFFFPLPSNDSTITWPLTTSYFLAYGAIGLVGSMLIKTGTIFRIFVQANGLFFGYHLTFFVVAFLSSNNFNSIDYFAGQFFTLKIIYVFLSFYFFESLTDYFAIEGYRGDKFRFLFNGLNGLVCGWLLSKGFGNLSIALNGIVFLSITFCTIWVFEKLVFVFFSLLKKAGLEICQLSNIFNPIRFNKENFNTLLSKSLREDKDSILGGSIIIFTFPFLVFGIIILIRFLI
ncbi:MAG: hypothetical protein JAY84_20120 [Candidatus Thiodiazotropha taylori]|nr:hypothetical protein [Candidatus Thiodiazotropha taylori]